MTLKGGVGVVGVIEVRVGQGSINSAVHGFNSPL